MMCMLTVSLVLTLVATGQALSGQQIASKADSHVGSTKWSYASSHETGTNTNKCNIFVADVIKSLGGSVPNRWWGLAGPIGAGEWGNPSSSYLRSHRCWSNVGSPRNGDVMGDGVHVAFYTGYRTTTSADRYRVVKNDWGFRNNQRGTPFAYWRYTC